MQAPRRIDDDGVEPHRARVFDRLLRGFYGVLRALFKHFRARLAADDLQLVDRRGAVDVAGDEQRLFALLFEEHRELAAQRGLARALQAAHHDDRRRFIRHFQFGVGRPHERDQLFVDDLDDLLGGVEAFEDLLPYRLFGDVRDELFRDEDVDVRLQQRDAHFAHGALYFKLGEPAVLGQLGKNMVEPLRER